MTGQRRWPVVAALGLEQILAWGTSYYLLTVLAAPIAADTGWPLPWIIGSLSAGLLVAGMVSPRVGRLIAQHGGRSVMAGSVVLLAAGLAMLGVATTLPVFLAAWLILGAGMGAGLYDAAFATLGRLYGASARPAITTLTLWGGFASTVCWPLSAYLVEQLGWRGACFVYAAIQLGIALPLVLTFIPTASALPAATAGDGPAPDEALGAGERRALLILAAIVTLGGATTAIMSVHLLTLLQERGSSLAVAVSLGALIGPSQVGARVLEMAGGGRHHPLWTLAASMVLMAFGLSLLFAGWGGIGIALVLYGAGNGIYSIARGTVPLVLFGPSRYATLVGRLAMPSLLAQALAPSIGAFALARHGATALLGLLAAFAAFNVVLVAVLWLLSRRS